MWYCNKCKFKNTETKNERGEFFCKVKPDVDITFFIENENEPNAICPLSNYKGGIDMNDKFKIYYDAEFTGLHRDTTLISIGFVSEDGHFFYGEFNDYDHSQCDRWIQENVISNLMFNDYPDKHADIKDHNIFIKGSRDYVGHALKTWLHWLYTHHDKQIQICCDCYAYDWMLFNDLICDDGKALNLPDHIYYIPVDLSTTLQIEGFDPDISREQFIGEFYLNKLKQLHPFDKMGDNCKHNSLWDAYVCQECFKSFNLIPREDFKHFKYSQEMAEHLQALRDADGLVSIPPIIK